MIASEPSPSATAKRLKHRRTAAADERLGDEEELGCARRDAARGQGAAARALDAGVDLAIDEVVVGRARAAHGDRADEKEREMSQVRRRARRNAGESRRPPAGQKQKLPADRPIEASELHIGEKPRRREARRGVDDGIGQPLRISRAACHARRLRAGRWEV